MTTTTILRPYQDFAIEARTPTGAKAAAIRWSTWRRGRRGAYLVNAGEYDLHEAFDALQADAERTGLVAGYGQDLVQQVTQASCWPFASRTT